ncbi:alpha/beta hydrolase [Acrocarpospora macrocephala]|uniref:Esterase n=1 Tax=Acrocarpospora macrocephala TaxID=150177 RepID=A0A5M3X2V7_9ACTN|nr:alpha/beta hydrolase [Acrocarpospora macrocephala]GES12618.1 esterase [Acrocarpospora macrocephala]
MTTDDERPALRLPARVIPVPASPSEEARAVLARGITGPVVEYPPLDDIDGWRKMIVAQDKYVMDMFGEALTGFSERTEEIPLGGFSVYVVTPDGVAPEDRRVYFDIHGGAWTQGGGLMCRATATITATTVGARVWAVDYRMPPDHRFPVALDDCLTAYRALLRERRPEEIIVGGVSAGGNLAVALMLRLPDEGLPLPAAVVLNTPATDLTGAGDTWQTNDGLDIMLTGDLTPAIRFYADGHDLRDPYLSPLFGDFSRGFPPALLLSGTRDRLLSDTVRMHRALRAAGVPADLHVWEAAGHGMFLGQAPEDREQAGETRRFTNEQWHRAAQVGEGR